MNYKLKSGFTLIEILVVVGLLGILVVIGSNMFFSILKNTAKSRVLAEVKQNGNHALSVMSRIIRNARSISACPGDSITIINPNRESTIFSFDGTRIASDSARVPPLHPTLYLTSDNVALKTGSFSFTCDLTAEPNIVTISFTLQSLSAKIEETAEVGFKTTVSLRTY